MALNPLTHSEMYPKGENLIIYLFKKAAHDILNSDEIDKLINKATGKEKLALKVLKSKSRDMKDFKTIPVWELIMLNKSKMFLEDVLTYMFLYNSLTVRDFGDHLQIGNNIP